MLESNADMQVIGEAENGQRAIEQIPTLQPDLVLMDIRMPVMDRVAATQVTTQQYPAIKVLVLTTFDNEEYLSQAMRLGTKGYLLKDTEPDELALAIRSVDKGHTHFDPGLFAKTLLTGAAVATPEIVPLRN
jgi:DNA-binding NarL/FixJ family response regulator